MTSPSDPIGREFAAAKLWVQHRNANVLRVMTERRKQDEAMREEFRQWWSERSAEVQVMLLERQVVFAEEVEGM